MTIRRVLFLTPVEQRIWETLKTGIEKEEGKITTVLKNWDRKNHEEINALKRFLKAEIIISMNRQGRGRPKKRPTLSFCFMVDPSIFVIWPIKNRETVFLPKGIFTAIRWLQVSTEEITSEKDRARLTKEAAAINNVRYNYLRAKIYGPKPDLNINERAEQLGILFTISIEKVDTWVLTWPKFEFCELVARVNGSASAVRHTRPIIDLAQRLDELNLQKTGTRDLKRLYDSLLRAQIEIKKRLLGSSE